MIKKLLFGAGLFTLGYVVGKAVGRAESEMGGQLGWEGDKGAPDTAKQTGADAEFNQPTPETTPAGSRSV